MHNKRNKEKKGGTYEQEKRKDKEKKKMKERENGRV